jgi:Domain of unknown function (DUF1905)
MKTYKFKAKIQAGDGGGAYVLFPFDVEEAFGTKGKIPVKAAFNGVPYSGSLIKYGHPLHMLGMPKAIREQTQTAPGDMVRVELWKDEEPRTIQPPAELQQAMIGAGVMEIFWHDERLVVSGAGLIFERAVPMRRTFSVHLSP